MSIRWQQALRLILDHLPRLAPVELPLAESLGRVLAEDVLTDGDLPPFDNSAMDGFAVRAADLSGAGPTTPVTLRVIADLPAGEVARAVVGPGEAIRIMTGAPLPAGADAVVPVERSVGRGEQVALLEAPVLGAHLRRAGEELRAGELALAAGTVLRPAELGVLATVGRARVPVYPAVRVAVMSTGDELVDVGSRPGPGQIRDSNSVTMAAQIRTFGGVPCVFARIRDSKAAVHAALAAARASADVLVTSGGVSMGEYDFVKDVLDELGATLLFWKIDQKPGHPLAAWVLPDGMPVFGIPGNPVSTMVCLEQYVRPALRALMGHRLLHRPTVEATLLDGYGKRPDGRVHFVRVHASRTADGAWQARIAGAQGSGMLRSMALANALAVIPEETVLVPPGGPVRLQLTEWPEDC